MVVIEARHAFGSFVEGGKDESFVATMRALREKPHLAGDPEAWLHDLAEDADDGLDDDDDGGDLGGDGEEDADDEEGAGEPWPRAAGSGRRDPAAARRWRHGVLEHLEVMLATRSLELRDAKRQLTYYVTALDAVAKARGDGAGWAFVHMLMEEAGQARPDAFRDVFTAALGRHPALEVAAEQLRFADGYELRFLRLPLLDALLEYLLTVPELGDAVLTLYDGLLLELEHPTPEPRARAIQEATNRLGRLLDSHLDEVVRSRDALDRYRRITAIVEAHSPPGQLVFDDANLLRFWQIAAADPARHGDYRLFQTAFARFTRLARELEAARQTMLHRRDEASLEAAERGALDLADLIERAEPTLDAFAEGGAFAGLKLLNKKEQAELDLVVTIGRVVAAFGRSLLRATTFGAIQSQMREAKRRRDRALLDRLATLAPVPDDAYAAVRQTLAGHAAHLRSLFLAALAVAVHHDPGFLDRGVALLEARDDRLPAGLRDAPEALLKRARAAFVANRRAGFRDALASPVLGELFIEAVPLLAELAALLDLAQGAIDRLGREAALEELLRADRPPFRATLDHLKES